MITFKPVLSFRVAFLVPISTLLVTFTQPSLSYASVCEDSFAEDANSKIQKLFDDPFNPLRLTIEADFKEIRQKAVVNLTQKGAEDTRDEAFVSGTVNGLTAQIRARGQTSLRPEESSFPKLKIEIDKSLDRSNSPFSSYRKLLVNTHVHNFDNIGSTPMGRKVGSDGPIGEFLLYKWAKVLGIETPLVQLARVDYIDSVSKEAVNRYALVIESSKDREKRLGGELIQSNKYGDDGKFINYEKALPLYLMSVLVLNRDFILVSIKGEKLTKWQHHNLYNYQILDGPTGMLPIIYDLDVSKILVEKKSHPTEASDRASDKASIKSLMEMYLQDFLLLEFKELNSKELKRFQARVPELKSLLNRVPMSLKSKAHFLLHLEAFSELNPDAL